MAKFITPGEVRSYTVGNITYHLRAPSVADRIAYEREAAASGARNWNEIERIAILREGVLAILPEDDSERAQLLEIIDGAVADLYAASGELSRGSDDPEVIRQWVDALDRVSVIGEEVQRGYPRYAGVIADNAVYRSLRGIAAAKLFLTEWEGIDGDIVRAKNRLSDESIARIPYEHFAGIGVFLDNMMRPTEAEVKNSESRQPGSDAATHSESQETPPPNSL